MVLGSQSSFSNRGGVTTPFGWWAPMTAVLYRAAATLPSGVAWSSTVVASFLWLLLNDQLHPALIYCLKLFLTA